ncbi:MAG: hypothetical protein ABJP34_07770 [Erythrobacter sp.]
MGMIGMELLAAVANGAPVNEFWTSHNLNQWWVDLLASALSGLVHVPLVLACVWGIHRLKLNRWTIVTAALATIFSIIAMGFLDLFVGGIYLIVEQMLIEIGVNRFMYMLIPNLLVCFVAALSFAWWLLDRSTVDVTESFQ